MSEETKAGSELSGGLDRCPFCGGKAAENRIPDGLPNAGAMFVDCTACQASTALVFSNGDDPRPHLHWLWNRREKRDEFPEGRPEALERLRNADKA